MSESQAAGGGGSGEQRVPKSWGDWGALRWGRTEKSSFFKSKKKKKKQRRPSVGQRRSQGAQRGSVWVGCVL